MRKKLRFLFEYPCCFNACTSRLLKQRKHIVIHIYIEMAMAINYCDDLYDRDMIQPDSCLP